MNNIFLRYSIVAGNEEGKFKVESQSGKILVAKDSEIGMYYSLEMAVTDGRFTDRCVVKIDVKKSDNSGLVFAKDLYHASVLENSTKSDIIIVVNVLGSALNENLQVNYTICDLIQGFQCMKYVNYSLPFLTRLNISKLEAHQEQFIPRENLSIERFRYLFSNFFIESFFNPKNTVHFRKGMSLSSKSVATIMLESFLVSPT